MVVSVPLTGKRGDERVKDSWRWIRELLTLVVELDNVELGLVLDFLGEEGLGGLAVWAVGLGEDD